MEVKQNPERYTPQEWFEDFAEFARLAPKQLDGKQTGGWMNFHFVTKYHGQDEARFRQERFEAAVDWLFTNIDSVNQVVGGKSSATEMQVTPTVLRMLYVVYGLDHGSWPIPPVPLPDMLNLLLRQIAGDKAQGIL